MSPWTGPDKILLSCEAVGTAGLLYNRNLIVKWLLTVTI
ncbi:hypothetical protein Hhis01_00290 [Haloarcula hispanica]